MLVTRFASHVSPPLPAIDVSWDVLAGILTGHVETPSKFATWCWSPTTFREGRRTRETALEVSAWVLDLDHVTLNQVARVTRALAADGLDFVLSSTYGHGGPQAPRVRFVGPLATPLAASAYNAFWDNLTARYAPGLADRSCRDVARLYLGPSRPANGPPPMAYRHPGRALVPTPTATPAPTATRRAETPHRAATTVTLQAVLASWQRTHHPMTGALADLLAGQPLALPGRRDTTTYALARDIVTATRGEYTSESLATLFLPSIGLMGEPPREKVLDQLERAHADLELPPAPPLPTTTWTAAQAPPGGLHELLLLTLDQELYCWTGTTYVHVARGETTIATIRRLLAPAVAARWIELYSADGRPKTLSALVSNHGRADIAHVTYAYGVTSPTIESTASGPTIVLPTGNRTVPPRFCAHGARFLEQAFPDPHHRHQIVTYLVLARYHPLQTLPALFLTGLRGRGKSLFAAATATLWHEAGAVDAQEIFAAHQERLLQTPWVVADEQFPTDRRGRVTSAVLRQTLGEREVRVDQKYRRPVTIRGAIRWCFLANDIEALAFQEALSGSAIDAINERFLHFTVANVAWHDIDTDELVRNWAGFVAWLRDNATLLPKQGRFWLTSDAPTIKLQLLTGGNLRSNVLRWIVGFALDPTSASLTFSGRGAVASEIVTAPHTPPRILIHARDLNDRWTAYVGGSPPTPHQIGSVLRTLARSRTKRKPNGPNLYEIDRRVLEAWCESTGITTLDEIDRARAPKSAAEKNRPDTKNYS